MSDRDAEFDAWLHDGDADMLESLETVVNTEKNLLRLKQNAAKRAVTVAHATGSDEPDRAIRSVLSSEIANAAGALKIALWVVGDPGSRRSVTVMRPDYGPRPSRKRRPPVRLLLGLLAVVLLSVGVTGLGVVLLGSDHELHGGGMSTLMSLVTGASAGAATALAAMATWRTRQQLTAARRSTQPSNICKTTESWTAMTVCRWTRSLICSERRDKESRAETDAALSTHPTVDEDPGSAGLTDEAEESSDACVDHVLCTVGGDGAVKVQSAGHRRRTSPPVRRSSKRPRPPQRSG